MNRKSFKIVIALLLTVVFLLAPTTAFANIPLPYGRFNIAHGAEWRIYADGVLRVRGVGVANVGIIFTNSWSSPWEQYSHLIQSIEFTGIMLGYGDLSSLFRWLDVTAIHGLNNFYTGQVTNMHSMFSGNPRLESLDLSSFDTRNVTNMGSMFNGTGVRNLNLSNFDTSNVTNMQLMFGGTTNLSTLNLANFNTANVTDMRLMFQGTGLSQLNLSGFNTGNVTNMSGMFRNTNNLTNLNLSGFNTANVVDMSEMFFNANRLQNLNLTGFDTSSVANMDRMFSNTIMQSLNLSNFDTSNVAVMHQMFSNTRLQSLDLSGFDTSNVWNMSQMFHNAGDLHTLDLSGFDTGHISAGARSGMFTGANNIRTLVLGERFNFIGTGGLLDLPSNNTFTGRWQNVGGGTVNLPMGNFALTTEELTSTFDGRTMADTWVRQTQPVAPVITVRNAPGGIVGSEYSFRFQASGTVSTWSAEDLPPGLSLTSQGLLHGTPTEQGEFTFSVTATNSAGQYSKDITIFIMVAPVITVYNAPNGIVGTGYSFQFQGTGYPSPTWSAENLPPGLVLTEQGILHGTPTQQGRFTFSVRATNPMGYDTTYVTIEIASTPTITVYNAPNGIVNEEYTFQFQSTGYPAPTWLAENLPPGLNLTQQGLLHGIPTQQGEATFSVTAINSAGQSTRNITITVMVVPSIVVYNASNGRVGTGYSFQFQATGFPSPTWSAEGLPPGLALTGQGILHGTPTQQGRFTFSVTATNPMGQDTAYVTIEISAAPTITVYNAPDGIVNEEYVFQFQATGYPAPTWLAGDLPPGLSFQQGLLHGVPTQQGEFTFGVTAINSAGQHSMNVTITVMAVPVITVYDFPGGIVGAEYSFRFQATGSPTPTWSAESLPPGLAITREGLLYGTPTQHGEFEFTVTATNLASSHRMYLTITILPIGYKEVPLDCPYFIAYIQERISVRTGQTPYPIKVMDVSFIRHLSGSNFTNLNGINYFTNLQALTIQNSAYLHELEVYGLQYLRNIVTQGSAIKTITLDNLPSLTHINLSRNNLYDLTLGYLPALRNISAVGNYLTGTKSFTHLPSLNLIWLADNNLAGVDVTGLANLRMLDLRGNLLPSPEAAIGRNSHLQPHPQGHDLPYADTQEWQTPRITYGFAFYDQQ